MMLCRTHWFPGNLHLLQKRYFTSGALKVLVFGSSDFGLNTLQALHDDSVGAKNVVDSVALITGRNTPMKTLAEQRRIPMLPYPPELELGQYDIGVVVSFGHLIPGRIIEKFRHGVVNVHPSLLPRWRGAAPITHTILAGDRDSGVSIMEIRPKRFDIGPVLMQETVDVPDGITTNQLSDKLSRLGAKMLLETLAHIRSSGERSGSTQSTDGVTYAHKLTPDLTYVNWNEQTCSEIDRQYRALHEHTPIRSRYLGKVIQLLNMVPSNTEGLKTNDEAPCGTARYLKDHDFVRVRCKDGWVGFRNVVYKKPMTAASFHNGYLSKSTNDGQVLESVENTVLKYIHQAKVTNS